MRLSGREATVEAVGSGASFAGCDAVLFVHPSYLVQRDNRRFMSEIDQRNSCVTEITLERTPCMGFCPVYKVTLRSDGTAVYAGERDVPKIGKYIGEIGWESFSRLAEAARRHRFFEMRERYATDVMDADSVIVSVVRNGKRKTVTDYGGVGPDDLWEFQTLIDAVVTNIRDWKQDKPQ